jgi:NAD(P)H-flavin reductase
MLPELVHPRAFPDTPRDALATAGDFSQPLSGFDIYMSGPPVMVEASRRACEACGATMDHMFSDAFTYAADKGRLSG